MKQSDTLGHRPFSPEAAVGCVAAIASALVSDWGDLVGKKEEEEARAKSEGYSSGVEAIIAAAIGSEASSDSAVSWRVKLRDEIRT